MASKTKRLAKGRKIRSQIGVTLGRLKAGEIPLEVILNDVPPHMNRVRLWTVMTRTPRLGEKGVKRILTEARVWPETRLNDLTQSEVNRIVVRLPQRAR